MQEKQQHLVWGSHLRSENWDKTGVISVIFLFVFQPCWLRILLVILSLPSQILVTQCWKDALISKYSWGSGGTNIEWQLEIVHFLQCKQFKTLANFEFKINIIRIRKVELKGTISASLFVDINVCKRKWLKTKIARIWNIFTWSICSTSEPSIWDL